VKKEIDSVIVKKKARYSSADNRADLGFSFSHGFAFLYNRPVFTSRVGYIVNPKVIINLTYLNLETTSSKYDNSEDEHITYDSGDGNVIEFGLKYFDTNSFYLKTGLYFRKQTSREKDIDDGAFFQFTSNQNGEGTVHDTGLILALGNQWQWSHFSMGIEWIGASMSVANWKYENTGEGTNVHLNNLRLLNFYVGASF
jgi:hypothetical protein